LIHHSVQHALMVHWPDCHCHLNLQVWSWCSLRCLWPNRNRNDSTWIIHLTFTFWIRTQQLFSLGAYRNFNPGYILLTNHAMRESHLHTYMALMATSGSQTFIGFALHYQ